VQAIKDAAQSVKDFFASIPGMMPTVGGGAERQMAKDEAEFLAAQGLSEGQIGEIMDADPRERGAMLGRMVGAGFQEGLTSTLDANSEAIRLYLEQIEQEARDQLEIKSPSQVFAEIGNEIGAGLALGIDESIGLVKQSLQGMMGAATGTVRGGVGDILSGLGTLFEGSKKISAGIAVANSFLAFTEVLKDPSFVGNPFGRFAAAASALSSGLAAVRGINSARPGGGGASGGSAGGGASATPAAPRQNITIDLVGDTFSKGSVQELFNQLNDGLRSGYQIEGVLVR
jgi:hypothetical protein